MSTAQRGIALKKLLIVLFVVVAVVTVGLAIYQKTTNKPEYRRAGDQFMASITTNDAQGSFGLMATDLQKQKPMQEWQKELNDNFDSYIGKAVYIDDFRVEDPKNMYGDAGAYRIKYRLPYKDSTYIMDVIVRKEGDSWKVAEFLSYPQ